jgi:endonuclease/exonuclease/phosphatase (EEP) superfamily protein YafD
MKLKPLLQSLGIVAIIFTLIPFIAADYWWIRVFDFPHTQLTILTLVALVTYFIKFDIKWVQDYVFVAVLGACFIFQLLKILPYVPHGNFELMDASADSEDGKMKFYISNVLQKNENPEKLINEIKNKDADVVLLMETNNRWKENVKDAVSGYSYKLEVPLENTYGMLLYSKFPFRNAEVKYLVDDSIPSMEAILQLPNGKEVQLFCIHPTPPMPQENPSSTDRDAEMLIIAKKAKKSILPVIVAGDFNDVAWSQSTSLFKETSGLLDPRIGRGFYNTFNAKSYIMRWPLDHFFASDEFRLVTMRLGEDIDSDHFPAYFEIRLEPHLANEQKAEEPTQKQVESANKKIEEAKEDNLKEDGKSL